MITLDIIKINEEALIDKINTNKDIRRRFFDIGLVPNTRVKCILKNSNMIALFIRGSIVAIRMDDLKFISAKVIE